MVAADGLGKGSLTCLQEWGLTVFDEGAREDGGMRTLSAKLHALSTLTKYIL